MTHANVMWTVCQTENVFFIEKRSRYPYLDLVHTWFSFGEGVRNSHNGEKFNLMKIHLISFDRIVIINNNNQNHNKRVWKVFHHIETILATWCPHDDALATDCNRRHTPMNWFHISHSPSLTDIDAQVSVCLSICRCECECGFFFIVGVQNDICFELYARIHDIFYPWLIRLHSFVDFITIYRTLTVYWLPRSRTHRVFFGEWKSSGIHSLTHSHTGRDNRRNNEKTKTIFARLILSLWFPNQAKPTRDQNMKFEKEEEEAETVEEEEGGEEKLHRQQKKKSLLIKMKRGENRYDSIFVFV